MQLRRRSGYFFAKMCASCVAILVISSYIWHWSRRSNYTDMNTLIQGYLPEIRGDGHIAITGDSSTTVSQAIRRKLQRGNGTYNLHPELKGKTSFSQYGQDRYIDALLKNVRNGFFVEIGGYDGQSLSNTLFLETERGWTGLLIEANPYMLPRIMSVNRKCYAINCCLGDSNISLTFTLAGIISSADKLITSRHRSRINNEMSLNPTDKHYNETVTVQCYSLLDILNVIGTRKVDYFSLDVEGAELYILASIDWDKIDIDVFTIETDQHRDQILAYMKDRGYQWLKTLQGDDIFRKKR